MILILFIIILLVIFFYRKFKEVQNFENGLNDKITTKERIINSLNTKITMFNKQIEEKQNEINCLKKEIEDLSNKNISLYIDELAFNNIEEFNSSDEYKNKLSINRMEQKELLKGEKAIEEIEQENFSKKIIDRNNKKQLISCFNAECSNLLNSLNSKNSDKIREKIIKSFDNLNKIFKTDNINLTKKFLELKLNELNLLVEISKKQQEEKEIEKARKEQLREEEKVRREIEKAKEKIEKEEKQFNNEMSKMISYLQKADNDIEKQIYADKIKELEEKLKLLEKDKENVLQRESNTRAGFVYVISNIGSFGENVFKIGMTRRLEPMDRISELSSASVPFPFDVHAIIFSEDAPALENSLHKYFQDKSVNKVNLRKEFFKIDIKELKSYIIDDLKQTVNFIDIPEADQYRESLIISENEMNN